LHKEEVPAVEGNVPSCGVIILAAGLGKRMHSDKAKVLHEIAGRAMVTYVAEAATRIAGEQVVIVIGHQAEAVRRSVTEALPVRVRFALQEQQLGTGHAVSCALPLLGESVKEVVILYGDVPLLRERTILNLIGAHTASDRELTVLAVELTDPTGYGRVLTDEKGGLLKIVEEADASDPQKQIRLTNSGIYCVKRDFLAEAIPRLSAQNAQGEYYLTDIVAIGRRQRRRMGILPVEDADETSGVNSAADLEKVRKIFRQRGPE
jgi:UDP-N-acetylglucosamine diphosphorylase/glucosamine-1-phosphate N-acetyltransferase